MKFTKVLITGASSGIGAEYARQLAQAGTSLILVARNKDRLASLSDELAQRYHLPAKNFEIISADLSTTDGIETVARRIQATPDLDFLINNAGYGSRGKFMDNPEKNQMDMIYLHVLAATALTRAALPAMITRKAGAIINVSSIAGFFPVPGNTIYCATKAYLTYFSESLQNELINSGIFIQALCPGLTRTEFHARMKIDRSEIRNGPWMTTEQVVDISLRSLGSGRVVVVPGFPNRLMAFLMETFIVRQFLRWYFRNHRH
jgi:short-subunit dehydrogenase